MNAKDGERIVLKRLAQQQSGNCPNDSVVSVPVSELKKLEQAREGLYEFLEGKLTEREVMELANITGQIWRIANTKKW